MRLARISRAVAFCLLPLLFAAAVLAAKSGASASVSLNEKTFDKQINAHRIALVKFIAPWCGHCKRMKEDWDAAAVDLSGQKDLLVAEVDATVETKLRDRFEIRGFPTIKLFVNGKPVADYNGERTKDALVNFVRRQMTPPVVVVNSSAQVSALNVDKERARVVAYLPETLSATERAARLTQLEQAARTLRELFPDLVFYQTSDVEAAHALGADAHPALAKDTAAIVVARPHTESESVQERVHIKAWDAPGAAGTRQDKTEDTTEPLQQFIRLHAVPLVGEISQATAELYQDIGNPLFIMFDDAPHKPEQKGASIMKQMAKKYRSRISFVLANAEKLARFREYIGCTDGRRFAIHVLGEDSNFIYDGATDEASIEKFISDYLDGKLQPTLRSEESPAENTGPVQVVVGKTWNQIVMDPEKDVFVEQYAPWCGHCRNLEPAYEELARKLAPVKTVVIAKMDATKNDAPGEYKARGFPTLLFFPAGSTKKSIRYEGDRSVADMLSFIQKHATHKFTLPSSADSIETEKDEL
jgi:protein disulfide isomerase